MRAWVGVVVAMVLGCGGRTVPRAAPVSTAAADAELARGCYACLIAARDGYRRAAAPLRVFEADVLIAMREQELGLPASDALDEARRLSVGRDEARYLALAASVPPSELARTRVMILATKRPPAGELAWLAASPLPALRDYVRLALACAYPDLEAASIATPTPLLAYRGTICGFGALDALAQLRVREPRFVESALFLASTELTLAPNDGPRQAGAHLAEVTAAFPRSLAASYLTGSYYLFVGDAAAALTWFDRTLAASPAHERALLGRVISLDRLDRTDEQIAAATQLIARNEHLSDPLFWRARGYVAQHKLDDARRDIIAAKEKGGAGDVLVLAGRIFYERGELDDARHDLAEAIAATPTDCTARWYAALVERGAKRWREAGAAFEAARTCFDERAAQHRVRAEAIAARLDIDAAYRDHTAAALRAAADSDVHGLHRAALVGASCWAAVPDAAAARRLLEVAEGDAVLAPQVAALRARLDATRAGPRRR